MNIQGISGNRDTDREILLAMTDKDLLKTCSLNKYFFKNVCDDNFFYLKLVRSYPDTLKYWNSVKYKNYKSFYLKMIYYVSKLLEKFKYSYVGGNPEKQFAIMQKAENIPDQLLIEGATQGEIELVKEAIRRGANVHVYSELPLRLASREGHLDIVKYLVENFDANIHANNEGALLWASGNGHLDIVKYLVEYTTSMFARDAVENGANANYESALITASYNGHLDVVQYLVEHGADIHVEDDLPLRLANHYGRTKVAEYLRSLQ